MVKTSNVITSSTDLDNLFDQEHVKKGIPPTFQMPNIGEGPKTVTFMPIIDAEGNPQLAEIVNLDSGPAPYARVMEYGKPEIVYKQALGDSLIPGMNAIRNNPANGLTGYNDFIGKTISIVATPYAKHPCPKCGTKGCKVCGGTGMSKVFSITLRNDLMSPTKNVRRTSEDTF